MWIRCFERMFRWQNSTFVTFQSFFLQLMALSPLTKYYLASLGIIWRRWLSVSCDYFRMGLRVNAHASRVLKDVNLNWELVEDRTMLNKSQILFDIEVCQCIFPTKLPQWSRTVNDRVRCNFLYIANYESLTHQSLHLAAVVQAIYLSLGKIIYHTPPCLAHRICVPVSTSLVCGPWNNVVLALDAFK